MSDYLNTTTLNAFNKKLAPKKTQNQTCTYSNECNDAIGLSCTGGICDCASNYYFNATLCGNFFLTEKIFFRINYLNTIN